MSTDHSLSCPKCGEAILPDSPQALCIKCLGEVALSSEVLAIDEMAGEVIGRYRLLEKIGEGGFGEVFMAEQREPISRKVALKVLKPGMDSRQVIARFESERQALALMDNPNIARILDAGSTARGRPYFVMELVRCVPVIKFCQEHQLDLRARLDLFLAICAAVQHAHQKGIIHRDLKPNNILVAMDGETPVPKVIDFGIAKALSGKLTDQTLFTQWHQFLGTPAYMSPEQAQYNATDIDTRTDIYALGVLLYELVTGTTPLEPDTLFNESQEAVFRVIREIQPPKPSTRITDLNRRAAFGTTVPISHTDLERDLDWVVMKSLEKDRKRRYATANALASDVRRFLSNEPVSAAAPSRLYAIKKFAKRNRAATIASLTTLAALGIGLAFAYQSYNRERQARTALQAERARLLDAQYAADIQMAWRAVGAGDARMALRYLNQIDQMEGGRERRHWLWRYLYGQLHRAEAVIPRAGSRLIGMTLSPDGNMLADIGEDEVQLRSVPDLRVLQEIDLTATGCCEPGRGQGAIFSDDGEFLYHHGSLARIHVDTGAVTKIVSLNLNEKDVPTKVSPNGEWIVSRVVDPTDSNEARAHLSCYAARDGQWQSDSQIYTAPNVDLISAEMRISPDSQAVTICGRDATVRVLALPGLQESARFHGRGKASRVAWSPDSNLLAITYDNPWEIDVWNVVTQELVAAMDGALDSYPHDLCFSHDGLRLAACDLSGSLAVWDVATGKLQNRYHGHRQPFAIQFLPGGEALMSASHREFKRWDVKERSPTDLEKASMNHRLLNLDYSPDGHLLACTAKDGQVRVFDAMSGALYHTFPSARDSNGHHSRYDDVPLCFASDGRTLVASNGDQSATVYDVVARKVMHRLEAHEGALIDIVISTDGKWVATSGEDRPLRLTHLWDLRTGRLLERLDGPRCVAFSPHTEQIEVALRYKDKVVIRNVESKQERTIVEGADCWSLTYFPDGAWLAVGVNSEVQLYETATGQRLPRDLIGMDGPVMKLGFSPDSRMVAIPTWGGDIQLWNFERMQDYGRVPLPISHARSAQFSPDGNTLAVSTEAHGVRLYRAPSWDMIGE